MALFQLQEVEPLGVTEKEAISECTALLCLSISEKIQIHQKINRVVVLVDSHCTE